MYIWKMAQSGGDTNDVSQRVAQEVEVEKNKREALDMAAKLYKIMSDPEMLKATTPTQRHQIAIKKCKNFADAYPLILAKLARDLRYNERAFRRFLNKIHTNPGKGMEGFMENQANYAKYLYEEECKANGRHINTKTAMEIHTLEYKHMSQWAKDVKKKEAAAKNEFEEEAKQNLKERRVELLEWFNVVSPAKETDTDVMAMMANDADYLEAQAELQKRDVESPVNPPEPVKSPAERVEESLKQREAAIQAKEKAAYLADSNLNAWKRQGHQGHQGHQGRKNQKKK